MVNYEMFLHRPEEKFHSKNLFARIVSLGLAHLKVYESYTTFFYPFDVSDGIKSPYTYTDSRIMSCKSADTDEVFIFLQN